MAEPLADVIARMQDRYRPHAVSPATATRKPGDTPPPAGVRNGYGTRRNTNANRRNGGGSVFYRPRADYYAGNPVPATARPTAPGVNPVHGIRVTGFTNVQDARVIGTDNGYRGWVTARANTERDAGDYLPLGSHYPRDLSARGNLAPTPRY
jgi:hypothetical protein